ncbi:hypothetical protein WH8501_30440 (plasmid) [Crocosphaera watsonii WH 8501]|uniref:Uncharacterized protein n=2 Tax=Crocosphaera watsonii TaxID=263511 RepID=Q4C0H8_CROWT|nr:hypothetical protein [Crocosphaera watsonii]EAM49657.1 hypothetical protein CwatDRAFT_1953 [Crocosphaera watsonii WH 8501]EAM49666.1 hypothetical protein CwatDRAFT_1963 [Crocosphaera watsonii WH 8501]
MSSNQKLDFNFRYRPNVDSPDGMLIRYLQKYKPIERKYLILKALRAFYLVAAYAELGDFDDLEQLETFVGQLRKTYTQNYDDLHNLSIDINLSIGSSASGFISSMPSSGDEDDDDDDEDDWD